MARNFVRSSSQYLERDSAPFTSPPFSLICWFKTSNTTDRLALLCVCDKDVNNQHLYLIDLTGGADDDVRDVSADTAATFTQATLSYGTNWHHAASGHASTTDREVYMDGSNKAQTTTSRNPAGEDRISIGRYGSSSPAHYMDGDIAEAAVYDDDIGDDGALMLSKAFSPLCVRMANLISYYPLYGKASPEIDLIGGANLTVTGATASAHPRVFTPRRK